jgi:redox-sensitive bicupin YhaK (pirin superfamily)
MATLAPTVTRHPAASRFHTRIDWLDSWHSFSFGHHYDPGRLGYRNLRVINDDRVAPGAGFPTHGHADMEIVTYVLSGGVAHRDSSGGEGVIRPGDAQRMSAGRGIRHSEYNASATKPTHFLQIWIEPSARGIAPGYEQKRLPEAALGESRVDLIASPDGGDGAVQLHADAAIHRVLLAPGGKLSVPFSPRRYGWAQVARGSVTVLGRELAEGDGLSFDGADAVDLTSAAGAELLLFDLA